IFKQAERIAVNRTVAGMHFPIDTWAGASLGEAIGQMILAKCYETGGPVTPRTYKAVEDCDFTITSFLDDAKSQQNGLTRQKEIQKAGPSPLFGWLWNKAVQEFNLKPPPPKGA